MSRWITFDCFGTLVDWNGGFTALLQPIAEEKTDSLLGAYHRIERTIEAQKPFLPYRQVLNQGLRQAAAEVGLSLAESQATVLSARWSQLPVFDDIEPAFESLRADGWELGVLTNCDDDLFAQTERNFRKPFERVVTAQQVGAYKPALNHFRRFAELTAVDFSNWIHVACSWYHDIVPAREMDIKRIWLDRDRTGDDSGAASLRIASAQDLAAAVKALEP